MSKDAPPTSCNAVIPSYARPDASVGLVFGAVPTVDAPDREKAQSNIEDSGLRWALAVITRIGRRLAKNIYFQKCPGA
jgi:hypothetical protein